MKKGFQAAYLAGIDLRWAYWSGIALSIIGSSLGLAWVSSRFADIRGFGSFGGVFAIAAGISLGSWYMLRRDKVLNIPLWLGWLLLVGVLVRLAAGVLWFTGMPDLGHGTAAEQAGYVMADAYQRDQAAWELAKSPKPLERAFLGYRSADQYGGLLFISALVYRYLGGQVHQPLLIVVLAAVASSLAVLFTWGFSVRAWDGGVAKVAAWGVALYPEAVLLGSSQMREAFTITLVAISFYGLVRYWQERTWHGLLWCSGSLILCVPFSPPIAALLLGMLVVQAAIMGKWRVSEGGRLWLLLGICALVVVVALWVAWAQFAPQSVSNPIGIVSWWLRKSADWQQYLSERASGWLQKIFEYTPIWFHGPFLLVYGIVRPFLPAALVDKSVAIWQGIAIWRAAGWTLLLSFLVYAPVRAIRGIPERRFVMGLSLVVWLGILVASFRGGGDQWDNPRYRAAFASLQVALAAWVWSGQCRRADPWFRRALIGVGIILAWFLPWYLRRYTAFTWPVVDLFKTVGLGVFSAVLFFVWDWARAGDHDTGGKGANGRL